MESLEYAVLEMRRTNSGSNDAAIGADCSSASAAIVNRSCSGRGQYRNRHALGRGASSARLLLGRQGNVPPFLARGALPFSVILHVSPRFYSILLDSSLLLFFANRS